MESTWENRDLPVLNAIVEQYDRTHRYVSPTDVCAATGLDEDTVQRALQALASEDPPYAKFHGAHGDVLWSVTNPTGHARRTVGAWPTAEALADRLIAGFEKAAEDEPDQERRGKLKSVAAWLAEGGRDFVVDVTAAVVTKTTGLSS